MTYVLLHILDKDCLNIVIEYLYMAKLEDAAKTIQFLWLQDLQQNNTRVQFYKQNKNA